jgi:hypothetical protein
MVLETGIIVRMTGLTLMGHSDQTSTRGAG